MNLGVGGGESHDFMYDCQHDMIGVFVEQFCFENFFDHLFQLVKHRCTISSKLLFVSKPPCFRQSFKHTIILPVARTDTISYILSAPSYVLYYRITTSNPPSAHRSRT